jgi:hypothetical protein
MIGGAISNVYTVLRGWLFFLLTGHWGYSGFRAIVAGLSINFNIPPCPGLVYSLFSIWLLYASIGLLGFIYTLYSQ